MKLWLFWWSCIEQLRPAFKRGRTFLWFAACVAAACVRIDLAGVTSFVRTLGLRTESYASLLAMFHSKATDTDRLARTWAHVILATLKESLLENNGRRVFVADGIKIAKTGRKMPAVKKLFQGSQNNNKREFIYGHSCQVLCAVVRASKSFMALPLACGIHEGIRLKEDKGITQIDRLVEMIVNLSLEGGILLADAYYSSGKMINKLMAAQWTLLSSVRFNAVAFQKPLPPKKRQRGRPRIYGTKVKLRSLFEQEQLFTEAPSPLYGEKNVNLLYHTEDLLWRAAGRLVRFVLVNHPTRGKKILICTDTSMMPLEIIELYGIRFKIEVSFKQALYTLGTYAYHFWMKIMKPRKRDSGDQDLRKETQDYRDAVTRKINAYHMHIHVGLIAQGMLQCIAIMHQRCVWSNFGSWLRTIRPGQPPSERVVCIAMRNCLPEFLAGAPKEHTFTKFIRRRIDPGRTEGMRLAS